MNNSKLYYYYGAMNCGKSASIIMRVHSLRDQDFEVMVMKPEIDTRSGNLIKSRAIEKGIEADLIGDSYTSITQQVFIKNPDVLFVDEVNFLTKSQVEELADIVDVLDIPIYAYGLIVDYQSNLFEGSKRMIELADIIEEMTSLCIKCGGEAKLQLRIIDGKYVFEGNPIAVGDVDEYESVCRVCYNLCRNPLT